MAANYEQPSYLDKRLRYFDGQFLKDQDFVDEQKYHVDRVRRLSRILQVSGIGEGLTVAVAGIDRVSVSPGTAIDARGRIIVLAAAQEVSVGTYRSKVVSLVIAYQEIESDKAQEGSEGNRRWHEKPLIQALADGETPPSDPVVLAKLSVNKDGVITVDTTARQYSGVSLPSAGGKGPSLRAAGDTASNKAILSGDLSVTGTLDVNALSIGSGGITASNAIINGNLTVNGSITGSSLSAGSATINGNLTAGNIAGSSLSLGSGNITAGDISVGRIACQNVRAQVVASNSTSTNSEAWVQVPNMTLTVRTGNNPVLIMFKGGGFQVCTNIQKDMRGKFRLLVDNEVKTFTLHEFRNSGGWDFRDVALNWLEVLSADEHTIRVEWAVEFGQGQLSGLNSRRSLIAIEL